MIAAEIISLARHVGIEFEVGHNGSMILRNIPDMRWTAALYTHDRVIVMALLRESSDMQAELLRSAAEVYHEVIGRVARGARA